MRRIILFFLILSISLFSGCKSEGYIQTEIEKAKYCEIDSDCVLLNGKCPFGCYLAINANEKERIQELLDSYDPKFEKCVYGCILCTSSICKDNKCKEICK